MKKMQIFEPTMCCSTGVCGVSVDPELLRISTVLNTLKKNGVVVERFNLSNSPMEFVNNKLINDYINVKGVEGLPATVIDDVIVLTGRYPNNEELMNLLGVQVSLLNAQPKVIKASHKRTGGC